MDGRELNEKLTCLGIERQARRLALNEKLATADELAVMSSKEVCYLIVKFYDVVFSESGYLGLVRKGEDMEVFNKLVKILER